MSNEAQQMGVTTRDSFLVFGSPLIGAEERDEILDCLDTAWLGTGPKVAQFEREFAAYRNAPFALGVHSCTAALHLSMLAADIGPGDEVITTPMTFCATVNAIVHTGATPVLADVGPDGTIDPRAVAASITPRTRALVPVHYTGRACDLDALMTIVKEHDLILIEDAAHAIETEYRGRAVGTFGRFGCFSFYATKNLATGEGGMVLTQSQEDADRIKSLALHGLSRDAWSRFSDAGYKHYKATSIGFKYNMMDLQAALGIHQLRRIERNWIRRQEIWAVYNEAFADLPVSCPPATPPHTRHGYHLYTLLIHDDAPVTRDCFLDAMTKRKIGVGVHYEAVPSHPVYQHRFGWRPEQWPEADDIGRRTVSIPLSAKLTDRDVTDVIDAIRGILQA